jgi:hypothetical protein
MLLQGAIVAGLIAILAIETLKRCGNSNQGGGGGGGGSSAECEAWIRLKYEYDKCVEAQGGAIPCSYGVYGNNGGTPPPPAGCGCKGAK